MADCGCYAYEQRKRDTVDYPIVYCPLHANAGELREVLEGLICGRCDNRIGFTGETKYQDWRTCSSCRAARAVLADTGDK